jgi:hypothetical protein
MSRVRWRVRSSRSSGEGSSWLTVICAQTSSKRPIKGLCCSTIPLLQQNCARRRTRPARQFLSRLSRPVVSRRKITRLFPAPCKLIQFQLSDQLIPVSSAAPSRARKTRCAENRRFSGPAIPSPALTPRCAGTSDDRPDLPADDWTAPCTAEPVAAAAIGLVVSSFAGAGAAMRSDSIARQQEQKN